MRHGELAFIKRVLLLVFQRSSLAGSRDRRVVLHSTIPDGGVFQTDAVPPSVRASITRPRGWWRFSAWVLVQASDLLAGIALFNTLQDQHRGCTPVTTLRTTRSFRLSVSSHLRDRGRKLAAVGALSRDTNEAGAAGRKERGFRSPGPAGWLASWPVACQLLSAAAFELTRGAAARRKARESPLRAACRGTSNTVGVGEAWGTVAGR